MDWTVMLPVLLTGGIFLIGFLSFLLVSFKAMFSPLQKDISRLDMDIKANKQELKEDIKANKQELKADMKANKQELKEDIKANKQELKAEIQTINAKLDKLITVTTQNKQKP